MGAQGQRTVVLGGKLTLDEPRPQEAGGAHFGDLHKGIHADRPEER